MLESLVAGLLNRFLGSYVQNFDPKQLNIGIWSGDVKLRNLALKKEALDKFRLPINVIEGHLGELVLQIPWSNLKNKPVKVVIEDVFLLAEPRLNEEYNAEEEASRAHAVKIERLENLELLDRSPPTAGLSPEEINKNQSFTESLVAKIVDNLQITIKNIHIRYEDFSSVPHHPFSLGFSLAELSAVSTDDHWNPIFIQDVTDLTRKLATLSSLSIYWDTDAKSIKDSDDDSESTTVERFKDLMAEDAAHQYILCPVSGVGRIFMNKYSSDSEPKTRAQLVFEELGFVFDSDQYRDALWTAELFRLYMRTKDFKKWRPKESPKEKPRAWLKYAANVVLNEIHEKNKEWSWDSIKDRRDKRVRYIELYKLKSTKGALDSDEVKEFDQLEWDLSYDDIRFYRSMAKTELRKEKAQIKQSASAPQQAQGWGAWLWGTSTPAKEPNKEEEEDVTMTDEQRQELYDAIEWDGEAEPTAMDIPKERVMLELETALRTGSFKIRDDPHGKSNDVAAVFFNGFKATFFQRPESFLANVSLQEFRVDDKSEGTLYEQVVTVKSLSHTEEHVDLESGGHNHEELENIATDEDAFFWLSFENNPLDGSADSNLFLRTKSITIFYNTTFIENVVRFFKPPKTHLETIGVLMNAAGATVEGLRQQSRIGLEYVLEEHKTANVKLDIKAPLIVMPLDSSSWSTPCAIIDAGHVSVLSDLVKREVLDEVKNKQTQKYTAKDWKQLESLMYDKFNVQLHDTQILIGPNVRETMKLVHDNDLNNPAYVIGRVNMDFVVEISILADAQSLTRFKVSGKLPLFRAAMSDKKYKLMMQLIDKAIPNLQFDTEPDDTGTPRNEPSFMTDRNYSKPLYEEVSSVLDSMDDSASSTAVASTAASAISDQKVFEFKFQIDKVELALHRCLDEKTLAQEPLVDMVLENFTLDFYYKQLEMYANVTLGRLNIEDYVDTTSPTELRRIATSDHVDKENGSAHDIEGDNPSSSSSETTDLFDVKYKRIKRASTAGTENEISDQSVEVSLSTLRFVVAPRTFLTLLDFVITTFTNPQDTTGTPTPDDQSVNSIEPREAAASGGEIDVKVNLSSIILTLNDDGIKLATLRLDTGVIGVRLVDERMKIQAKIGSFTLNDDMNEGSSRDSVLRQLISSEGDELADFTYETFDAGQESDYDSSLYFHTGSIKVNVVETPMTKIMNFLSRFQQMKGLFDAARQAAMNQASHIQAASKMHFDVLVNTPIVVFPRPTLVTTDEDKCDIITANLGELYIKNEIAQNGVNTIHAAVRAVRMTSCLYFSNGVEQVLEILDNVDLLVNLVHNPESSNTDRPLAEIDGSLSDIKMNLTDVQYQYLLELTKTIPAIFSGNSGMNEEEIDQLEDELRTAKNIERRRNTRIESGAKKPSSLDEPPKESSVPSVDLKFALETVALTIYADTTNIPVCEISKHSLSSFSLNDTGVKFLMHGDNSIESDIHVHSLILTDTREVRDNKFPEIIPSVNHEEHQFMCRFTRNSTGKRSDAMLSIDSPRMILAMDYLIALKEYAGMQGSPDREEEEVDELDEDDESALEESVSSLDQLDSEEAKFSYHLNVIDASLILLADPSLADSEAIVFKTEQLILSSGETTSLSASKIGMFLCRMSDFDKNRLRILDDFSISASVDGRGSDETHSVTSVQISVEPLLLRLSVRDILLASAIMSKASKLSGGVPETPDNADDSKYSKFTSSTYRKRIAPSTLNKSKHSKKTKESEHLGTSEVPSQTVTVRGEELTADLDGMRLVIIGMAHELPIIDSCVKPFTVTARNWSSDLRVDASTEMFSNIYNISKSAWEPLVESWVIGFHLSKTSLNNNTFINLFSRKLMELTVTSQTIQTLNSLAEYISTQQGDAVLKPRETSAPYRIKNETGYTIEVSPDSHLTGVLHHSETVEDGQEREWQFVDWHELRENLSTDQQQADLTVKLLNSPYDAINGVSVTAEGEQLYVLSPKETKVSHRLSCEVKIHDSIKWICLRSAYTFRNDTNVDLELGVVHPGNRVDTDFRDVLKPGQSRAIPIPSVQDSRIIVRPRIENFRYRWCDEGVLWKNLIGGDERSLSLTCRSKKEEDSLFYIQADANYDSAVPLTQIYPYMTVVLSAPLEIVNLLPYDFNYRLYNKHNKKDWLNTLKKGDRSPVHVVSLQHLLLLSVEVEEAGYDKTEFAIINSPKSTEFKREDTLLCHSKKDGQRLKLRIHYYQPEGRTGYHVVIYSPYVVLNKVGLDLQVATRVNTANSKVRHEHGVGPLMWSFDTFGSRSNRSIIRVGDSRWSGPQSFEAIGTVNEVVIPLKSRQSNIHVGVDLSEGSGLYKVSKIVTISPRFIFVNKLKEDIQFREPDGTDSLVVRAGQLQPLHTLRQGNTQIIGAFAGSNSQWSAPFDINNVGRTYVKLYRPGKGFLLLKVDILIEQASLFLHLEDAGKQWPFSIRNFTNFDFIFFQANPYVDDQGVERNPHPAFTPIRYKIPAKSVMPYSWDYPAAPYKELVISYGGRERRVQLAEIGSLPPMKLPRSATGVRGGIVDLDVVADGPLATLVITDYDPATSMYQLKRNGNGNPNSSTNVNSSKASVAGSQSDLFQVVGQDDETESTTNVKISFEGVGISLINKRLEELCYITLRGFEFHYKTSELYETFSMKMKWMQIDNQLYGGIFPVILFPSVVPKSSEEMENHPTFSTSITRVKDESHGVLYIKYATVLLQQITLDMDEDFLLSLMDFVKAPFDHAAVDKLCDNSLQIPQPVKDNSGLDVYFETLHIQPAQMDLSFVRTERINVEDRPSSQNTVTFFFNVLTMAIGNINDAPVKLNALLLENVRTPLPLLVQTIQTHYSQEFIYQIHKILGSADFLGNPVGLFNNISSGFMDMFYEPYLGYIHSDRPQDLGIGIAKGGASFAKKTVFGISDSISKWAGSISKGLAVATMDQSYQDRRRLQKSRNRPQHALYGLSNGATSFVDGIAAGLGGLALSPIEGASKEGAAGFFKGLGKGLVGLPTKTAIGLFDMASNVSEGVRNTTTVFDGNRIAPVRPSRFIENDGIVRPFSEREAVGQTWLKTVNDGTYFTDRYLAHLSMSRDNIVVVVTFKRVIMMSTSTLQTEWEVKFQDLQTIVMERTGIALVLRGGVQGPFVPIPNNDSRQFLYREMGIAVREFNRKHQTLS